MKKINISGISTITHGSIESRKLAILLPGYLDSKDYAHFKFLADSLSGQGFLATRFDPTGTWESEGKIEEYSLTRYLKDVDILVKHASKEHGKPFDEVVLIGHSFGGRVAIIYGAQHPEVSAVICIMSAFDSSKSPYTSALLPKWKESGVRISKRDLPENVNEFIEYIVPYSYQIDRENYDFQKHIKDYKNNLLVIAGELDDVAPPDNVKTIYEMANEPKEFKVIQKIGHRYRHTPNEIEIVNKEIIRFLHEQNQISIVDENDIVIGAKQRFKVTYDDIYRVTGLWITNNKGEILLAQRALTKSHSPGCWSTAVSGTVEAGESYEENIYKEAEEELGIKDEKFEKGLHSRSAGPWQHFTQWYFYKTDKKAEDFQINKNEIQRVKWFKPEEILKECEKHPERFLKSIPVRVREFSNITKEQNV